RRRRLLKRSTRGSVEILTRLSPIWRRTCRACTTHRRFTEPTPCEGRTVCACRGVAWRSAPRALSPKVVAARCFDREPGTGTLNSLNSVVHRHPKSPRVIRQHVVVDPKEETPARSRAIRTLVAADEEDVVAAADPSDERRRRTIGKRTSVVARRVAFAFGAVAAI